MLNVASLSVRVVDLERDPVSSASVSLISQSKGAKPINLDWNKKTNLYSVEVNNRGTFKLTVSATRFDSQERVINLPHPATVEEFILGKKGMPFYYRGRVKTPFEPKLDLIGVTVAPGVKDGMEKIRKLAKRLRLSEVKTGDQIRNNNVLIFQHSAETSDEEKQKTLDTLLRDNAVQLAGPVVELFEERAVFLTSQLQVKFRPNVTSKLAEDYGQRHKLRMVRAVQYIGNAYLFEAQPKADYSLLLIAAALAKLEDVEYAEPNSVTTSMLFVVNPADFLVTQQWHIPLINLPDAWQVMQDANAAGVMQGQPGDLTYGDENLVIAVADTGIQSSTTAGITTASHPDFSGTVTGGAPKVAAFYDFINMVANNDTLGFGSDHGMGCAGVATAQADNAASVAGEVEGLAGAAGNCQVIGMVVPFGQTNQRWADALVWMAGFNPGWVADVINYPLGTIFPVPLTQGASIHTNSTRIPDVGLLDDTLDFIAAYGRGGKGVVSFLAAGNTAANISHPSNNTIADHDKVITVAASINTDVRSGYSCFDPAIDICAPSSGDSAQSAAGAPGKVTSDTIGGGNLAGQTGGALNYRNNFGGTSSATPLAAGVGALMLSINPQLNWVQVRDLLRNSAVKIDAANTDSIGQWSTDGGGNPIFSQWYGFGRVDAKAATTLAENMIACSDIKDNASSHLMQLAINKHNHIKSSKNCTDFEIYSHREKYPKGCKQIRIPQLNPCFYLHWGDSKQDIIETEDFEVVVLSVCNPFDNVSFQNLIISGIKITHADGSPVEVLPDKTPSALIIPSKLITFCSISPCSCSHIELVIKTSGAIKGPYKVKFNYCIGKICLQMIEKDEAEFDIELIKS